MLRYAEDLPDKTVLKTDICIIGSGAAGLPMADRFRLAGKDVIVLESSRYNNPPALLGAAAESLKRLGTLPTSDNPHRYEDWAVQPMYEGDVSNDMRDQAHDPNFPTRSRIRVYGGTTNCWGGWTRPLAPADFEANPFRNVPWPFDREALREGYKAALHYCSLPSVDIDDYDNAATWEGRTTTAIEAIRPSSSSSQLTSVAFTIIGGNTQQDNKWDFQKIWGPALESENTKNVTIYRNANVRRLIRTGNTITGVSAQTVDRDLQRHTAQPGKVTFTVQANRVILAAGGIETVRLLLLSNLGRPPLGSYFMVHPVIWNAGSFLRGPYIPNDDIQNYYSRQPSLATNEPPPPAQIFAAMTPTSQTLQDKDIAIGNFRAIINFSSFGGGSIGMNWEQQPNVGSGLGLDATRRDLFGDPLINVNWLYPDVDKRTAYLGVKMVAKELFDLKYAASPEIEPRVDYLDTPGDHHMGASRMHLNPNEGYVDLDCKVYGINNLFIAGPSVFPTGGYSNPTLTIIALAIRLADHLISM